MSCLFTAPTPSMQSKMKHLLFLQNSASTYKKSQYPFQMHTSTWGGLFFCGDKHPKEDTLNGFILNVVSFIKNTVSSEAESEVGACFQNAQSGAPIRVTLTELGHIQPATPLHTDNFTAFGILNNHRAKKVKNNEHEVLMAHI
jgi:hypothetical protein